ncbi:ABC transporter permease [Nocardioides flavescens]|uniref:ABC transporter permease n=1 Tax=Nocardioides flavescens TaxID=2691959 RepID=A0A6L7EX97_9ACTN|nr:ABC transporter permease [Nocardioides flavescens]MXG88291.1 ABC transporter permease [Nocardioides flavescens]
MNQTEQPRLATGPLPTAEAAAGADPTAPTASAAPPAPGRTRPSSLSALGLAERYALLALLVVICVGFTVIPTSGEVFSSLNNVNSVLRGQTAVALIALAAVFPLVTGHIDFSLGATTASSMVLSAGLMSDHGTPLVVCALASVALGALIGLFNGVMVTRFRLDPFVTTLGVATLLGGLIQWYTGGQTIFRGISSTLTDYSYSKVAGLPQVTAIVAVIAVVAWYLLAHTPFGRSLYAIGANQESARLVGLPVRRNVMLSFVIAGTIAGAAGLLRLAVQGSATSDSGTSLLFPALAAVFLGATAIRPGFFNVAGTVIGVLFVSFSVNGLTLSGVDSAVQYVFNGVALLAAVGLSTYLGLRRRSRG